MRLTTLVLVAILAAVSFFAFAQEPQKPNNWQPVYDFKVYGQHAYMDANSFKTDMRGKSKYNTGQMLVSSDVVMEIPINGKIIKARSMVKLMVVECNSGIMVPIFDLYFSQPMPTRKDKPLGGFEYPSVETSSQVLPKNSILYNSMCPEYI